jgi:hypothetical protein
MGTQVTHVATAHVTTGEASSSNQGAAGHPHSRLLLHPIETETPIQAPPTPEIQWEEEGVVAIILE